MKDAQSRDEKRESLKSWLIMIVLPLLVTLWGLLIWTVVGDRGLIRWDYSIRQDVPGESVYSTQKNREFGGLGPAATSEPTVVRQHVMGQKRESEEVPTKSGEIK
jgi:hypothetical protein